MCFTPDIPEPEDTRPLASKVADTATTAETVKKPDGKRASGRSSLTIDVAPKKGGTGLNLPV